MKVCTKCWVEKELSEYGKDKTWRLWRKSDCKECKRKYDKIYRWNNSDKKKINDKLYRENNKDSIIKYQKKYRIENRDNNISYQKEYRENVLRDRIWRSKRWSEEHLNKMRWPNNPAWNWWSTELWMVIRGSDKNDSWRFSCMERDWFRCRVTWKKWDIVVHHLQSFKSLAEWHDKYSFLDDERLFDINNWITLDRKIHKEFHSIYWNKSFTELNFMEFFRNKLLK